MPPLAGRPPYATDEADTFYETPPAPQRRARPPGPPDPNKRTSAYDVYDNYLAEGKSNLQAPAQGSVRDSGIGALLLGMGDDSDDDSDDDDARTPAKPPGISGPPSKHAALAAATTAMSSSRSAPPQPSPQHPPPQMRPQQQQSRGPNQQFAPPQQRQQPPPPQQMRGPPAPPQKQHQQQQRPPQMMRGPPPNQQPPMNRPPHSPQPGVQIIAAPRPGYAAPIAALNLARPEPSAHSPGRQPHLGQPPMSQNPLSPPFVRPPFASPASPSPSVHSSTPHPLQPPVTPITPAFIRPSKSPVSGEEPNAPSVKFSEPIPRKPIMRSNSEDPLLPGRGEKGDDFWRRFSMVAKEENRRPSQQRESSWLRQTQMGASRHSRWVWMVGLILLLCIGGGVGLGIYFSRNNNSNTQAPTVLGGSDGTATAGPTPTAVPTSKPGQPGPPKGSSSALHVSPTHTIDNRAEPSPTPYQAWVLGHGHKRRMNVVF